MLRHARGVNGTSLTPVLEPATIPAFESAPLDP